MSLMVATIAGLNIKKHVVANRMNKIRTNLKQA